MRKGLVQIFTGNGKGKTSAALGTVVRSCGHGMKSLIIFFMKGEYPYGETRVLCTLPNVEIAKFGSLEFVDPEHVTPDEKEQGRLALEAARKAVLSGVYDLVVLDEINVAVSFKLVELEDVVSLIKEKPPHVELILTGRYADPKLIELADLVTEMVKVKHPYDRGVPARKGIEY